MVEVVPSKPWYSVSKDGKVVVWTDTKRLIPQYIDSDGYHRVNYKGKHAGVHRLVAEVYCVNKDPTLFTVVNHLDNIKSNNACENLEWTTPQFNRIHSCIVNEKKRGELHNRSILKEVCVLRACQMMELGMRTRDITAETGIDRFNLNNIKLGKSWSHISKDFSFVVSRKETISKATIQWVEDQLKRGRSTKEILSQGKRLDLDVLSRAIEIVRLLQCND